MSVSIIKALEIIQSLTQIKQSEIIPIEESLKRVAATTLKATLALPPFNNSAMDGYGLKGSSETYQLIGKLLAGDDKEFSLQEGECVSIMTGAKVPQSVDTVIPQENTSTNENTIKIEKAVQVGANIRYSGEDINVGENIVDKGTPIDASHIGLLASQGVTHIEVYKKPKIAIFASGSELKLHFEKLNSSQIYNSNTPYLIARAKELGCETTFIGKSDDNLDALKSLIKASLDADLIVTSGGVSVGEADFTKEAFSDLGMEMFFDKIKIKPGKPTTFGMIDNTLILNLPGNPLASALNFELFGKVMIAKMSGKKAFHHQYIETNIASDFIKNRKIDTIIPGEFDGSTFSIAKQFAPGMVNVLNHCNGYLVLGENSEKFTQGDSVKFLPIKWDFQREDFIDFRS
ncbi:MAG: molybdopterin molybdotransferase MoeA [Epsilonproteobacteria bacterium]|nr:molybdopterin molybdotransferase MoeA [Campylobacterota bacterium]